MRTAYGKQRERLKYSIGRKLSCLFPGVKKNKEKGIERREGGGGGGGIICKKMDYI
jgi:hypothetical protein